MTAVTNGIDVAPEIYSRQAVGLQPVLLSVALRMTHHQADAEDLVQETYLRALESLPVRFLQVVLLADVEGYSYKEIAASTGIPLGTVMSRLHRGRQALRATLLAAG